MVEPTPLHLRPYIPFGDCILIDKPLSRVLAELYWKNRAMVRPELQNLCCMGYSFTCTALKTGVALGFIEEYTVPIIRWPSERKNRKFVKKGSHLYYQITLKGKDVVEWLLKIKAAWNQEG